MRFRPKIKFNGSSSPPIPPIDPDPEIPTILNEAGGWGDLGIGGKITGGAGAIPEFWHESSIYTRGGTTFTGFNAMWEKMRDNRLTPQIMIWDGGDIVLDPVDYRIDGGNCSDDFSAKNKTIMTSQGQTWRGGSFPMSGWENLIWRNIVRKGDGLGDGKTGPHSMKGIAFRKSKRCWVDHCEIDGEATLPGTEQIKDGSIDFGCQADFITVSNTYIRRSNKTSLISGSPTAFLDRDKNHITFRNCRWENNMIRQPIAQFGQVHILNCLFHYTPYYTNSATQYDWCRIHEIGIEVQMYAQGNKYYRHRYCFDNRYRVEPTVASGLILEDCWIDPNGLDNRWSGVGYPDYTNTQIRPENVLFNPNTIPNYVYPVPLMNPDDAEAYVLQWAGAKYHLKYPIV